MNRVPVSSSRSKSRSTTSTAKRDRASRASFGVPHSATVSKSVSETSNRRRPSRNNMWSSSSNSRMRFIFNRSRALFRLLRQSRQFQDERTSRLLWIVPQVSAERSHESARQIESQPGLIGALLQGLKDLLPRRDSRTAIGEADRNGIGSHGNGNLDRLFLRRLQHTLAVLHQVQQNLKQAVTIRLHARQLFGYFPFQLDIGLLANRLKDDSQIGENFFQVHTAWIQRPHALLEFERSDLAKRLHQRSQRFEILIASERPLANQVFVHHADGAAHIPHLVRDSRDQNTRPGEKLLQTGLLALAQVFGCIDEQGREPGTSRSAVSGKEDVRKKGLAIFTLAARLHF